MLAIVLFGITATILPSEPVADEPGTTQDEAPSGTLSIPGIGRIDLGKLNEMGKRLETMSKGGEGTLRPIDAVEFKALLPLMLPGNYKRTETDTSAAVGIGIATASGSYKNGENTIMLSITDMGMAGAMAALTGALGANSSEETADSYSRLKTIDGRMTMEEYNSKAKTGTYSFMVADRIMVKAKGHGASIDELKASAHTIDTARVEALAQN